MTITTQSIITFAALLAAIIAILKYYNKVYDLVTNQKKQDNDIKDIKREVVYALSACLDGLTQLGANHNVPQAKQRLDNYINQAAHDQL